MKFDKFGEYSYFVFRVVIGLMFLSHGTGKIFGEGAMSVFSMMGFVGLMEILGGLAIAVGVFTRLAASGGAVLMVLAYFRVHFPNAILPMNNGGELAVMYFVSFLVIIWLGAKKWGIEKAILGKEVF